MSYEKKTWFEARDACEAAGATLPLVEHPDCDDMLRQNFTTPASELVSKRRNMSSFFFARVCHDCCINLESSPTRVYKFHNVLKCN